MSEQNQKMSIPPSLTYIIEHNLLDYYAEKICHFNNKMINTLNTPNPTCITPNKPLSSLPYISLSTLGVKDSELDFGGNAADVAPVKMLRAYYEGEERFLEEIDSVIQDRKERIEKNIKIINSESEKTKIDTAQKENIKYNFIIDYCLKDKENLSLIKDKLGKDTNFYRNIFNKKKNEEPIPVFARQVLIYDEGIGDYISITPIFSLIMSKKLDDIIKARKEELKDFKIARAYSKLGGENAQNVTAYNRYSGFRLFMSKMPAFKDQKYVKLWRYIHKGFDIYINKNIINSFIFAVNKYIKDPKTSNKEAIINVTKEYIRKNIQVSNNINSFISQIIKDEINKDELLLNSCNIFVEDILEESINNKVLSENLLKGNIEKIKQANGIEWLFKNKKKNIDILTDEALNKLKTKLLLNNISLEGEVLNIIKNSIKEELDK